MAQTSQNPIENDELLPTISKGLCENSSLLAQIERSKQKTELQAVKSQVETIHGQSEKDQLLAHLSQGVSEKNMLLAQK